MSAAILNLEKSGFLAAVPSYVYMTQLPTREIANFIFESESEFHILTVFCSFTASSKDD